MCRLRELLGDEPPLPRPRRKPEPDESGAVALAEAGFRMAGEIIKCNLDYARKLAAEYASAYEDWKY